MLLWSGLSTFTDESQASDSKLIFDRYDQMLEC